MRWLIVVVICAARLARADVDGDTARRLFEEAIDDFTANRIDAACPKLEASIRLRAEVKPLGLLAACYEKQGKLATAYRTFKDVRKKAEAAGDNDSAVAAAGHVARLEPKVARLTITGDPAAKVTLDSKATQLGTFEVDAGRHMVASAGFAKAVDLKDGETSTIDVPKPAASTGKPDEPGDRAKPPMPAKSSRRLIGIGVLGGGVAITAVGGVFGLQARSLWSKAQDQHGCNDAGDCADRAGLTLIDDANRKARLSTVLVGVGLAAIGGGVVLYLTAPKATERARVSISSTGRDVVLMGRF